MSAAKKYPLEHDEQVAVIQWFRAMSDRFGVEPEMLFAIPNGGLRHPATAKRLVDEGVVAGVADLFLAVPTTAASGLWVEMKRQRGGSQKPEQKLFEQRMRARGYEYVLCRGAAAAIEAIEQYLTRSASRAKNASE